MKAGQAPINSRRIGALVVTCAVLGAIRRELRFLLAHVGDCSTQLLGASSSTLRVRAATSRLVSFSQMFPGVPGCRHELGCFFKRIHRIAMASSFLKSNAEMLPYGTVSGIQAGACA